MRRQERKNENVEELPLCWHLRLSPIPDQSYQIPKIRVTGRWMGAVRAVGGERLTSARAISPS